MGPTQDDITVDDSDDGAGDLLAPFDNIFLKVMSKPLFNVLACIGNLPDTEKQTVDGLPKGPWR